MGNISDSDNGGISLKESHSSSGCDESKSLSIQLTQGSQKHFIDELIPEIKPILNKNKSLMSVGSSGGSSLLSVTTNKPNALKSDKFNQTLNEPRIKSATVTSTTVSKITPTTAKKMITSQSSQSHTKKEVKQQQQQQRSRSPMHPITGPFRRLKSNNLNISADYNDVEEKVNADEKSNMFLYIDLHGHASKKGVFMYGNHLPNTAEAVECMLLPRLMSMNCHHFHFDACNFSERNMYLKGKKDGLSKEGSGRVSVYKAIGLIKSYTLESNYNTGKCVNILPPKGKDTTPKMINMVPPKYNPGIFEEVFILIPIQMNFVLIKFSFIFRLVAL